jgi:hypothetical protein
MRLPTCLARIAAPCSCCLGDRDTDEARAWRERLRRFYFDHDRVVLRRPHRPAESARWPRLRRLWWSTRWPRVAGRATDARMDMQSTCYTDGRPSGRSLALVAPGARKPGLWAPCLSALCFVHCAGTALVVPWVPALATLAEARWLEWSLLGVSGATALWALARGRPSGRVWLLAGGALGLVLWGLLNEHERAKQIGFLGMAAIQTTLALASRGRPLHPHCCSRADAGDCDRAWPSR